MREREIEREREREVPLIVDIKKKHVVIFKKKIHHGYYAYWF